MIMAGLKIIFLILDEESEFGAMRALQVYPVLPPAQAKPSWSLERTLDNGILIEADSFEDLDIETIKALYFD